MDKGFYSAVSGAISQNHKLDVIANNLANANTPGFKQDRVSFSAVLADRSQATRPEPNRSRVDLGSGGFEMTKRSLDLAIQGDGFFGVLDDNGNTRYTRAGNFQLNRNNELVTATGHRVIAGGGAVVLPHSNVLIDGAGRVWDGEAQIGQIDVYETSNPAAITKAGVNMFNTTDPNSMSLSNDARVLQGMIESSNVNGVAMTTQMIETQRIFEATQNLMRQYGEIAVKANEIGSY